MDKELDQESRDVEFYILSAVTWLGSQRHRVDRWLNCRSPVFPRIFPDTRFNTRLVDFFVVTLLWTLINLLLYDHVGLETSVQSGLFVAEIYAAAVLLVVLMKTMRTAMKGRGPSTEGSVCSGVQEV